MTADGTDSSVVSLVMRCNKNMYTRFRAPPPHSAQRKIKPCNTQDKPRTWKPVPDTASSVDIPQHVRTRYDSALGRRTSIQCASTSGIPAFALQCPPQLQNPPKNGASQFFPGSRVRRAAAQLRSPDPRFSVSFRPIFRRTSGPRSARARHLR